jgi:polyhydroxybutyrate depolymerase
MVTRSFRWILRIGLAVAVTGCSGTVATSPDASSAAVASKALSSPSLIPSSSPRPTPLVVGGPRPAIVRLPTDPGSGPAPLILALHGFGSNPADLEGYFRVNAYAGTHGVVVAFPEGSPDQDGNRFWNATDACCNFYGSDVDDVAYLATVIEEVGRITPIDPKRVYVIGHSNGGFMSYRMACEKADVVAAVVSLAGATFDDKADCKPSEPVSVVQLHGTADDTVLFAGGTLDFGGTVPAGRYPGAITSATSWATYDRCTTKFDKLTDMLDIETGTAGPNGPSETEIQVAKGCRSGASVELWTLPGGSHVPSLSPTFASAVVDFLLAHPKR